MDSTLEQSIKAFLRYSLEPVDFDYDELTLEEQSLVTREEFEDMVNWLLRDNT